MNAKLTRRVAEGLIALACATTLHAADITLRLGHLANEENSWHKGALKFAEEVGTLTQGKINIKVFPNDSLGTEIDLINALQLGTADLLITGELLQNQAPKAALLALPYSFKSLAEMDKVVSGPLGEEIRQEIMTKAKLIPLAYFARGPRNLTSNKPIRTVDDVKGLKMRVPNVAVYLQFWRGINAQPMPMAFVDIFNALQSGEIEAQENPLALIKSARLFEVQKYVNRTEHVRSWIYLTIGEKSFNRLSTEQQAALREAARRAQVYERKRMLADEQKLEAELKSKGMIFIDTDQSGFARKAKESVLAAAKDELKPLIQKIYAK